MLCVLILFVLSIVCVDAVAPHAVNAFYTVQNNLEDVFAERQLMAEDAEAAAAAAAEQQPEEVGCTVSAVVFHPDLRVRGRSEKKKGEIATTAKPCWSSSRNSAWSQWCVFSLPST